MRKSELHKKSGKVDLILELLKSLVYPRLQENHYQDIHIVYEQFDEGSSKSKKAIIDLVKTLQNNVSMEQLNHIEHVDVSFADKNELCLSIPDYIAGVVRDFISVREAADYKEGSLKERNYHRISGKIRLMHDYTRGKYYSRKNSFI